MRETTPDFTLSEIDAVMIEHRIGEDGYVYTNAAGKVIGRNVQQYAPEYRERFCEQVNHVARLLRYADRTKMREHTVHDLKVEIEQATHRYVTNGSVLVAAVLLGISVKRTEDGGNGAYLAVSRKHKFPVAQIA